MVAYIPKVPSCKTQTKKRRSSEVDEARWNLPKVAQTTNFTTHTMVFSGIHRKCSQVRCEKTKCRLLKDWVHTCDRWPLNRWWERRYDVLPLWLTLVKNWSHKPMCHQYNYKPTTWEDGASDGVQHECVGTLPFQTTTECEVDDW